MLPDHLEVSFQLFFEEWTANGPEWKQGDQLGYCSNSDYVMVWVSVVAVQMVSNDQTLNIFEGTWFC